MMFRIVLMTCFALSMGFRLNSEVDNLPVLMAAMDEKLTYLIHEASLTVTDYTVPIRYYADEAEYQYNLELTKHAQVYWDFIEDAEAKAVKGGTNIDACVAAGNTQVYALNASFVDNGNKKIEHLHYITNNKLEDYQVLVKDQPLQRLTELWLQVRACKDDDCAIALEDLINDTYEELVVKINDALTAAEQLVLVDYVGELALYNFEDNLYSPSLDGIVTKVTACIDAI